MGKFLQSIINEYPLVEPYTVWSRGMDGSVPLADINLLISNVVDEVKSDILIVGRVEATGISTQMPEGTLHVSSASLSGAMPFQGNRLVKVTYNPQTNTAYCRYYPAVITYQRLLKVEDLDNLRGDQLIYVRAFVLWKMAEKELHILKVANMQLDNGEFNLQYLEDYRDAMRRKVEELKPEILIYSTFN